MGIVWYVYVYYFIMKYIFNKSYVIRLKVVKLSSFERLIIVVLVGLNKLLKLYCSEFFLSKYKLKEILKIIL